MKTIISIFSAALVLVAPLVSDAAINSLNGLNGASQTLVATTSATSSLHMTITSTGTSHTFSWDNTAWPVRQGGTGWTSFTAGALLYGNGTGKIATTSSAISGQILQFNGSIPTWVSTSSLGISASPAGSNGQIQFNNNGVFGGDASLVISTSTHTITVGVPGTAQFTINASAGSGGQGTRLSLYGGDGGTDSSSGGVAVYGGTGNGTGPGGQIEITAGGGGDTGPGGTNFISGGDSGASGGNGGDVSITSGFAANTIGTGGHLRFTALCNASDENCGQFWFSTIGNTGNSSATTTVNFAQVSSPLQHACFNMKDSVTGGDVSFYIANGAMVVENNVCR